jgi:hypothetical protein
MRFWRDGVFVKKKCWTRSLAEVNEMIIENILPVYRG